jgi:hypothetical protein
MNRNLTAAAALAATLALAAPAFAAGPSHANLARLGVETGADAHAAGKDGQPHKVGWVKRTITMRKCTPVVTTEHYYRWTGDAYRKVEYTRTHFRCEAVKRVVWEYF